MITSDSSTNEVPTAITFYTQADKQSGPQEQSRQSGWGDAKGSVGLACQTQTGSFFPKTVRKRLLIRSEIHMMSGSMATSSISLFTEAPQHHLQRMGSVTAELIWTGSEKLKGKERVASLDKVSLFMCES